jgi:hypothetical protein
LRGAGLILTMVPTTNLALGTLPPERVANASGLFTVCRNLGGAIGIAILTTMMISFSQMHEQQIASGMSLARPEVQSFLSNMTAQMQAAGVTDPEGTALAQLVYRTKMEAAVMTYNNLFLTMSMSFALVLLVGHAARQAERPGTCRCTLSPVYPQDPREGGATTPSEYFRPCATSCSEPERAIDIHQVSKAREQHGGGHGDRSRHHAARP